MNPKIGMWRLFNKANALYYKPLMRSEKPVLEYLELVERIARVLGQLAIPVVIAIIGVLIQKSLATMDVHQKYVELALSVLTKAKDEVDQELRVWAVDVLQAYAPIPLKPETVRGLKMGEIVLLTCSNECAYGAKRCQVCGNYDSDACAEWSDPIYYPQSQTQTETP